MGKGRASFAVLAANGDRLVDVIDVHRRPDQHQARHVEAHRSPDRDRPGVRYLGDRRRPWLSRPHSDISYSDAGRFSEVQDLARGRLHCIVRLLRRRDESVVKGCERIDRLLSVGLVTARRTG